jgi:hypothetical protein
MKPMIRRAVVTLVLIAFFRGLVIWGCSGIYLTRNGVRLFALNEDFWNSETFFVTMPKSKDSYGIVGFGHSNTVQAIVNERGLCYDGYGAPEKPLLKNKDKPLNNGSFIVEAMRSCETVDEVVSLYNTYYNPWLSAGQAFFCDKLGNAVIIEGDAMVFKSGDYQIITNFYQSDPASGINEGFYPCRRFSLLDELLKESSYDSIESLNKLLAKVKVSDQASPQGPISTLYSLIIDQNTGNIHIFHPKHEGLSVVINIEEELKKSTQRIPLEALFESAR